MTTETRERIIWPLLISGIGMFAGGWAGYWLTYTLGAFGYIFSSSSGPSRYADQWGTSFIPVAGPWMNIADNDAEPIWPAIMGLLQAVGLVLFVVGLCVRETVEVELAAPPPPQLRVELGSTPMGGPMLRTTVNAF